MIVYHTPIKVVTIAKNGSERFGAKASCECWQEGNEDMKMEVNQDGKTKAEAKEKLQKFLSSNGKNKTKEVKPKASKTKGLKIASYSK